MIQDDAPPKDGIPVTNLFLSHPQRQKGLQYKTMPFAPRGKSKQTPSASEATIFITHFAIRVSAVKMFVVRKHAFRGAKRPQRSGTHRVPNQKALKIVSKEFQSGLFRPCAPRGKKADAECKRGYRNLLLPPPPTPRVTVICRTRANEFTEARSAPSEAGRTASNDRRNIASIFNLLSNLHKNRLNCYKNTCFFGQICIKTG